MAENTTAVAAEQIPDYNRPWSARSIRNYAAGFLSPFGYQGLSTALFSSFFTLVYSVYLGVRPGVIATVMTIGIVVDAITDVIMGLIMDRFYTKWGKAKHWFLWMALPIGLTVALMWHAPQNSSETTKFIYALIMYNLFCTFCTAVRIPSAGIASIVTENSKVRANLGFFIGGATTIATSLAGWLLNPCIARYGETLQAYRMLAIICGVLGAITLFATGLLMVEQRTGDEWRELDAEFKAMNKGEKRSTKEDLKILIKNKYWVYNTIISFFSGFAMGFAFGTMGYFMQFVMKDMSKMGVLLTVMSVPNYLGCIAGLPIGNWLEARATMIISNIIQLAAVLLMWIGGPEHWNLILIGMCVKAFMTGATQPAAQNIGARIVDYGEWQSGVRQDGLTRSWQSVFQKISSAIVTALLGYTLAAAGYQGGAEMPQNAVNIISFFFLGFSAFMLVPTIILYFLMDLSEDKMKVYRAEIAERRAATQAQMEEGSAE